MSVQTLADDLRYALRTLRTQPRYFIVGSLTLALGIGAVTAIFSVVNGVLLTPLPYPNPDRLVNVWSSAPGIGYDRFPLSPDLFLFFRRHAQSFDDMALFERTRVNLTGSGSPEVLDASVATHTYFSTLGVAFSRGRSYTADEDKPGAPSVAVISHRLWTRRFAADPSLIGRTISLDGEPAEVVGIGPPWLDAAGTPEVWLPARFNEADPPTGSFGWNAIGRLKPGVRADQAAAGLDPLVERAMTEHIQSDNYRGFLRDGRYHLLVHSMKEDIIGSIRQPLWILLGTVGMVLLVACSNVANLSLIRADGRQRDMAIRAALGARRTALVRAFLAEAMLLAFIGSVLGVLCATLALPLLLQLAPGTIPRLEAVRVSAPVLLFSAGAAVVSALIFGLVPAIRYTRPRMLTMLRHGGRSATDHPSRQRGRQLLVVAQTAMALVLLVGSALLARSFTRLMNADHGFVAENVLTFRVTLPPSTYGEPNQVVTVARQLVDRLAELAGIETAGATTDLPVSGRTSGTAFEFEGRPIQAGSVPPIVHYSMVTPGYFDALRIALIGGAGFDSGDLRDEATTVLVNRAAAERYWAGQDAVGKRLRLARPDAPWFVVKGVVADVRHDGLREPPRALLYFPLRTRGGETPRSYSLVLRGPGARAQAEAARQTVWAVNPDLPVASMRMMDEVVGESVMQFTFTMLTLGIAAAIALVLGAIGLYGVQSYAVSLRTREIGVRVALGAQPSRVMRSVLGTAAAIMAIGLVAGSIAAATLTRLLEGMLYETRPLDPVTFATMAALLFAVGLLASYLPARRAAAVNPMEAMRGEG